MRIRDVRVTGLSLDRVEGTWRTPSPYLDALVTEPFQLDAEGYLAVPTAPGLGVELDRDALARFARP
jgi:L-alanine-DL-glutamate epimerase-like enolase superfamily enzyme